MSANAGVENVASEFATYEEFLESQITPLDLYYLQDEEVARRLVELGFRGSGEVRVSQAPRFISFQSPHLSVHPSTHPSFLFFPFVFSFFFLPQS
jgi:hypothetical protein